MMYFKYGLFGLNVRCSLINKFYFHHHYFHIWYNCYCNNYLPLLLYNNHCTRNHFFPQMFWKDGLFKKIALEYDLSCIIRKDDIPFFPKIWPYSSDRKWKKIFLKKIHGNMIFSASVLKRWSFQETRTGIWSSFNCQERWYFYFPEIWSRSSSSYFELMCSNLLV